MNAASDSSSRFRVVSWNLNHALRRGDDAAIWSFIDSLRPDVALADVPLAGVYTSPLRRASETAAPIADRHGLKVGILDDLIDLDHGRWEGLTAEEAEAADPEAFAVWRSDPLAAAPPGGEAVSDAVARAGKALREILHAHPRNMVAMVSHEVVIRGLLAEAHRLGGDWMWSFRLDPGSVHRLRLVGELLVPA